MRCKMLLPAGLMALAAVGLSGCFDFSQRVAIGRDGSGQYELAITAQGLMGEALKNGDVLQVRHGRVANRTVIENGNVTRTARVEFSSLSELSVPDEAMSIRVIGHDWFGLGPTDAILPRSFLVQSARRRGERRVSSDPSADDAGMAAAIFGDHTYSFSVTLPGTINWIAPVRIGSAIVKPQVTGNYFGHTVTWRIPLSALFAAQRLRFEVGFSAWGSFGDAQSMPVDNS